MAKSVEELNTKVDHFGVKWSPLTAMIHIHMWFIQQGGEFKASGGTAGRGLFFHYSELAKILWPEEDDHRWWQLCLKVILENPITAIMGPKDSGKTHCMGKFGLMDYWCFPHTTLILISSTDLRGLEYRIWGDLKGLFQRAKDRFDFLAGHPIDSKHAICTDNIQEEEVRDMRKGIVCIPCVSSNGQFVGLGKYVGMKQKRRRLLSDECFPAGTMINTETGLRPIETISVGDYVWSATGLNRVHGTGFRTATSLVTVHCENGRSIKCTPEHPFFTQMGWIKACKLNQEHYIMSPHEAMQIMQKTTPSKEENVLQQCLLSEIQTNASLEKEVQQNADCRSRQKSSVGTITKEAYDRIQSNGGIRHSHESFKATKGNWMETSNSRWKWHRTHQGRGGIHETVPNCRMESSSHNRNETGQRISDLLQIGCGISEDKTWNRIGRSNTLQRQSEGKGFKENQIPRGDWVDRVEISKHHDVADLSKGKSRGRSIVYNLQVEGHPSYSVEGLLVHNCQFMKPAFLDSLANLNSGNFKGVFVGNPLGEGDPLDKISEPLDGWGSINEPDKTATWPNKFEGTTINLVGTDSPNFDFPQDQPVKFPYLINQKEITKVENFYGKNSLQYYSQVKGVRKTGLYSRRVITLTLCKQFGAMETPVWFDTNQTRIYAVDAAYGNVGGDRCVGGMIEFGRDATGSKIILAVGQPVIIPIQPRSDKIPEDQIAQFVKEDCENQSIPPEHVFYDSTGRGSLGTSFARLWSANVNPVEFGGNPTGRPVCSELMTRDVKTGQMRLKRCDEHYSKFVTELWFSVRYVIESRQMRNMPVEVIDDGCAREWYMVKGDKIEIEPKEETKLRTNRSPDLMDWLCTAVEGARRLGFSIARMSDQAPQLDIRWKDELRNRALALRRHGQLIEV